MQGNPKADQPPWGSNCAQDMSGHTWGQSSLRTSYGFKAWTLFAGVIRIMSKADSATHIFYQLERCRKCP